MAGMTPPRTTAPPDSAVIGMLIAGFALAAGWLAGGLFATLHMQEACTAIIAAAEQEPAP